MILQARDLVVGYGKLRVLDGISIGVDAGESVALLGTNGAGKSTALKAMSGLLPVESGQILVDGDDVTGASPAMLLDRGIVHVPGGHCTFPAISVEESLRVAMWPFRKDAARVAAGTARVYDRFPVLGERRDQLAGSLSGGEQQMLALSRALVHDPRLVIIDELSLGLAPTVVETLAEVLAGLRADGVALLIVEQRLATAIRLTERAYFLERGRVQFDGPTADLRDRGDLVRAVFLSGAAS